MEKKFDPNVMYCVAGDRFEALKKIINLLKEDKQLELWEQRALAYQLEVILGAAFEEDLL